jgi:DNA-binding PadR family transcriptional regulator
MQQEVVLAMLAKEPSHGYELLARLGRALGPVAEGISEGQMYVTLTRLEKGGFVARVDAPAERSDRKVYRLTPAGQERVTQWLSDVSWPRPDLTEFHMKLIAAAQSALADPPVPTGPARSLRTGRRSRRRTHCWSATSRGC